MNMISSEALFGGLKVLQNVLGVRSHIGIGAKVLLKSGLDEELLDNAVVDNNSVSPGALTKATLGGPGAAEAHGTGESAGTVGNQLHLLEVSRVEGVGRIGLLLLEALVKAPLSHHESVIDTQAVDLVDSVGLDLLIGSLVPGKVGGTALRSEGCCKENEQDNKK